MPKLELGKRDCTWPGHCAGAPCQSKSDCDATLVCSSGWCNNGFHGDSCHQDSDCNSNLKCVNQVCGGAIASGKTREESMQTAIFVDKPVIPPVSNEQVENQSNNQVQVIQDNIVVDTQKAQPSTSSSTIATRTTLIDASTPSSPPISLATTTATTRPSPVVEQTGEIVNTRVRPSKLNNDNSVSEMNSHSDVEQQNTQPTSSVVVVSPSVDRAIETIDASAVPPGVKETAGASNTMASNLVPAASALGALFFCLLCISLFVYKRKSKSRISVPAEISVTDDIKTESNEMAKNSGNPDHGTGTVTPMNGPMIMEMESKANSLEECPFTNVSTRDVYGATPISTMRPPSEFTTDFAGKASSGNTLVVPGSASTLVPNYY